MKSNKLKKQWINNAKLSLIELMESSTETCFDVHLFGDQAGAVLCQTEVKFPNVVEKPLQALRASRLKLLGYKYNHRTKSWIWGD